MNNNIVVGDNVKMPLYNVGDLLCYLNSQNRYIIENVLFSPYYQKWFYVLKLYNRYNPKPVLYSLNYVEEFFYKDNYVPINARLFNGQ